MRKYIGDRDYVFIAAGMGSGATQRESTLEIFRLHSQRASIGTNITLSEGWTGSLSLGVSKQEYIPDAYRLQYSFSLGVEHTL